MRRVVFEQCVLVSSLIGRSGCGMSNESFEEVCFDWPCHPGFQIDGHCERVGWRKLFSVFLFSLVCSIWSLCVVVDLSQPRIC